MAQDERVARTVLKYEIDKQALQQLLAATDTLLKQLKQVDGETAKIGKTAGATSRAFASALSVAKRGVNDLIGVTTRLQSSLRSAVSSANQAGGRFAERSAKQLAVGAAGVAGGALLSANRYADRFAGVEKSADQLIAANKRVEGALDNLGRTSAEVVTPSLETFADLLGVVAEFLKDAVPEGTNPLQDFLTKDIPAAIVAAEQLVGSFRGIAKIVQVDLANRFDDFGTGISKVLADIKQGAINFINGILDAAAELANALNQNQLASGIRKGKIKTGDQDRFDGKTGADLEKERLDEELRLRKAAREKEKQQLGDELVAKDQAVKKSADEAGRSIREVLKVGRTKSQAAADYKDQVDQDALKVEAVKKYNATVKDLTESNLEARAAIEKNYADKLVDIARQAADAADNAYRKLLDQRADLARNLGRDEQKSERDAALKRLDIQIDSQRDEAKAYRDHQRQLEQIRKQAADREFDLILNRDFLGLFNSRRQTTNDINDANQSFTSEQSEKRIAQQEQFQDLQRSLQQERNERLISYSQQLEDAQLNYSREIADNERQKVRALQLARIAHNQELQDLQQKYVRALGLQRSAIQAELTMLSQSASARLQIAARERDLYLKQAAALQGTRSASNAPAGSQTQHRAAGGFLGKGQTSWVNESFNGVPFPPGLGVFIPAQAGNVTRSVNANQTNNIYGANAQQIVSLAAKTFETMLERYLT